MVTIKARTIIPTYTQKTPASPLGGRLSSENLRTKGEMEPEKKAPRFISP